MPTNATDVPPASGWKASPTAWPANAPARLARTDRFSAEAQRGGLPRLAADSVALRRGALERTRLHAESLADALSPGDRPTPEAAIAGWALAGVLQLMLEELGAAQLAGEDTASTATRLGPELDRQLTALEPLG